MSDGAKVEVFDLGVGRPLTVAEQEQLARTFATNKIVDGLKKQPHPAASSPRGGRDAVGD